MFKRIAMMLVFCMMCSCCAQADGYAYDSGDRWDKVYTGTGGIATAEVISKSVTLRDKPSMSGSKIVSIPSEEVLMVLEEVNDSWLQVSWQKSAGKVYEGYIRTEYVVVNPEYITLRRSNTAAYSVPSRQGKTLGSLAKMTRLRVLGTWDEYYVVFLRGGAAFIPMDADVWTETELNQLRVSTYSDALGGYRSRTAKKTSLRTGPGKDWPEIMQLKSGTEIDVRAWEEDGWVFVKDLDGNMGYVSMADVE